MSNYQAVLDRINQFIRKYYTNELIRGSILFVTLGLLYFLMTLYVEYFLWLKPPFRLVLFILFIIVELFLLYRYILVPIFKLIGLRQGIDQLQASKIIGDFFPDIDDKLINTIQLHEQHQSSDLIFAGVEQRSQDLKLFSFSKAVNFKVNYKYLKYLVIPVFIYLLTLVSGRLSDINHSYERLTHPQMAYTPPAPFSFELLNDNFKVVEGEDFTLQLHINGQVVPDDVYLIEDKQRVFMQKISPSDFTYTFKNVRESKQFALQADPVTLSGQTLHVIETPKIKQFKLMLNYPSHTRKKTQIIKNAGNAVIPEGTRITWSVETEQADSLHLLMYQPSKRLSFKKDKASFSKTLSVKQSMTYAIVVSNAKMVDYEKLVFDIKVIKDELPKLFVQSDIDSLSHGEVHFVGRLTDDYGLHQLNLVYYQSGFPNDKQVKPIEISKAQIADFICTFPGDLPLKDSENYSLYFEVFDNDIVNGYKSVKSKVFSYYKPSNVELEDQLLKEQEQQLDDINDFLKKQSDNQKMIDNLEEQLKSSPKLDFNTEQALKEAVKRHEKYDHVLQQKLQELNEQLNEHRQDNDRLEEKQNDIEERIKETLNNKQDQKLLDELKKLSDKLDKEELVKKMQQMSSHSKYKEKSLKELLELTKRFYVEQQLQHITDKLDDLSKKQEELASDKQNSSDKQKTLNDQFKDIKKQIDQMMDGNKDLKKPISIDPQQAEQQQTQDQQQQAQDKLEQQNQQGAKKSQVKASSFMKMMSESFSQQMSAMQQESIKEDIASLRRLLDNLLTFSFEQEEVLSRFKTSVQQDANFAENLKQQYKLKTYFQHIDDSLYTLSMRQEKLSKDINKYLDNAHYYLNSSIASIEDNKIDVARADQQYVMTAANDLAYMLSALLDNLQDSQSMGFCSNPGNKSGFTLPDIIKKQSNLSQATQKKLGEKGKLKEQGKGQKSGKQSQSEQQSGDVYDIYKQQAQIRQQLEEQLENLKEAGQDGQAKALIKQMEQLEQMLLDKGITQEVLQRMTAFEHQLLKLKNATYTQERDNKRVSKANKQHYNAHASGFYEKFLKDMSKEEILNREPIPFHSDINIRINRYFKTNESTQP